MRFFNFESKLHFVKILFRQTFRYVFIEKFTFDFIKDRLSKSKMYIKIVSTDNSIKNV